MKKTESLIQNRRGWFRVQRRNEIPNVAGCYAIYEYGKLIYIGSSLNLRARVGAHLCRGNDYKVLCGPVWKYPGNPFTAKVRVSRRNGDWLMWEWRLITRLQPRDNRAGVSRREPVGA